MAEFILDHGTYEASQAFKALDSFTQGYFEAMFFTECHSDNPELDEAAFSDLVPDTLAAIIEECRDFQKLAAADLEKAYDYAPAHYDAERAGNDFWYTRNGHGTGFWDRGLGDLRTETVGGRLSRDAKSFSSRDLYRGDKGLLYLS